MTRISHYDQGDIWSPQATFTVSGVPTDPGTVTVKIRDASGVVTVVGPVTGGTGGSGIVRESVGVFHYDVTLNDAGYWYARFEGTGAATAADDQEAIVDPSPFFENAQIGTRALLGISETRDWLNQQNQSMPDELELSRVITDVSNRIHEESEREFMVTGTNPQTRVFYVDRLAASDPWYIDGQYMGSIGRVGRTVKVGDLVSYTAVQVLSGSDWTTVLATPSAGQTRGLPLVRKEWEPFTQLEFRTDVPSFTRGVTVSVTGTWGFPSIPGTIRQAALDAVAWTINRDVENYRTDLGSVGGERGPVITSAFGAQKVLSLPPQVLAACWGFRSRQVG